MQYEMFKKCVINVQKCVIIENHIVVYTKIISIVHPYVKANEFGRHRYDGFKA